MSTCPNCHQPVGVTDDICENCGVVLASVASAIAALPVPVQPIAPDPALLVPVKTQPTICPNCQQPVKSGEDICEQCGMLLTSANGNTPADPPATSTNGSKPADLLSTPTQLLCPGCQHPGRPGVKFCNRCGYRYPDSIESIENVDTRKQSSGPQTSAPSQARDAQERAEALLAGSVLNNKYRIVKTLGVGGMGAVYLAEDQVLQRRVVIKALLSNADPDLVAQSIKEREFLAAIKHVNIVSIYDFITMGSQGYIVMEYVHGKTLDQIIEDQGGPLDVPTAIRTLLGILPAFSYLAKLGLVYCDFKPQNVMLETLKDGSQVVKLIDLGTVIKHVPRPGTVYGTHGFYAPEAVHAPSPETDLYSLCRTLAYLVTLMDLANPNFGMPPSEYYKAFRDHLALYRLLCKGTHAKPQQRFHSAEELGDQLAGVLRQVVGGDEGMPVSSRLFVSGAMTTTGKLGPLAGTALDESDKVIGLLRSGDQALRAGRTTAALTLYRQAAKMNAKSVDAHLRIADILIKQGELSEALAEVTRAQRMAPGNWKVAWYTGRLLEAQGKLAAAVDQYHELMTDLPGELPPIQALARVYARLGNDSQAVAFYETVLKADPGNIEAMLGITQALLNLQRWYDAIKVLSNVGEAATRYVDARLLLCDIYLNRIVPLEAENVERAAEALSSLTGRTEDAHYYLMRAEVYRAAWRLACAKKIPTHIKIADVANMRPRTLGLVAERSYQHYLQRVSNPADRETIIRRKLEVAPWRLL